MKVENDFRLLLATDYEYDDFIIFIFWQDDMLAILNREKGPDSKEIEILESHNNKNWYFLLKEFRKIIDRSEIFLDEDQEKINIEITQKTKNKNFNFSEKKEKIEVYYNINLICNLYKKSNDIYIEILIPPRNEKIKLPFNEFRSCLDEAELILKRQ